MMGQRRVWGGVVRTRPGFGALHRHTPIAPPLPPQGPASNLLPTGVGVGGGSGLMVSIAALV